MSPHPTYYISPISQESVYNTLVRYTSRVSHLDRKLCANTNACSKNTIYFCKKLNIVLKNLFNERWHYNCLNLDLHDSLDCLDCSKL